MRSMRSTPTGGRPLPAFGYTGSIRAHSSRHGTTRSISARNCARRVVFAYFSKPVPASVICLRAIITSRGRPLPVSSQHVGLKRERVIQRFPNGAVQIPSNVKGISHEWQWHAARIGGRFDAPFWEHFNFRLSAFFLPWSSLEVRDTHYLRP